MADNVNITAGTGTVIATDQVGTDHYQKVKLADGTADSSTMVNSGNGAATNALRVTLANDSTGVVSATSTGNVAHDGADSGNPIKVGAKAIAHGSNPTAVAAADRTDLYANRHGIPWVIGGHPNIVTVSASYTTTQADTAIITVGAGTKVVVTSLAVYADGGGTGPLDVQIAFGTATVNTAKAIIDHPGLVVGSGVVLGNGAGIIACGADNEDLRIDATGFGTGDELTVCCSYYTIES